MYHPYPEFREKFILDKRFENETILFQDDEDYYVNRNSKHNINKVGYYVPYEYEKDNIFDYRHNFSTDTSTNNYKYFGEKVFLVYEYNTYYYGYFANYDIHYMMINKKRKESTKTNCFPKYYEEGYYYFVKSDIFLR